MLIKRLLLASSVLSLATLAHGCATEDALSQNVDNATDHSNRGKWAVDMKKVDAEYGRATTYFLGMTAEEAGIPGNIPGAGEVVWDLTAKRLPDGSIPEETGNEIAVIDRDGKKIDPLGYVNIIPMLGDTDPAEQEHIKKFMQNGDIIVYLHPEDSGNQAAMERRASHVAMHYEHKAADGTELVHHIDNPNSYGPRYNHRPNRHMPFNVYRFRPKKSDTAGAGASGGIAETVEGVAFTAAQRDKVLEIANTATQEQLDVDFRLRGDAAEKIVKVRDLNGDYTSLKALGLVPNVGPSALQTLRDLSGASEGGAAQPITDADIAAYGDVAAHYAMMTNDTSPFADFFTLNLQTLSDLPAFAEAAIHGEDLPELYCSGLAFANLNLAINYPLNKQALGDALWAKFTSSSYSFSDSGEELTAETLKDTAGLRSLNRLVFEPYGATDILNAWIDNYWYNVPLPVRQQVIQSPELQAQVVQGFSQLEWSDDQADEKQSSGEFSPATQENVARWAKAYGLPADKTEAYLAADAALAAKVAELGIPTGGLTPMEVLQAVEQSTVDNRFVPPQIWMDEADRDDSSLMYVGTVLNCELLVDVSGANEDPCGLGGGGSSVFSEGASDTSTYPHFAIQNGGLITHRRFDVVGPETFGPDSTISVRVTHGAVEDMVFLAHVPATWGGHPTENMAYTEYGEWCKAALESGGHCAAETGILLKADDAGSVDDATYTWRLGDVCEFGDGEALCPMGTIGADGRLASSGEASIGTWADGGRITVSFLDLGSNSAAELDNCAACPAGGGQANQILVTLR